MKRIFSLSLVAGLTLVVVSVASVAIVNAQAGMVSSILNRMTRGQQSLKTLRANIVMEKYNSQIREETLGDGVWTQHLKVTPKGAASYKYIELWVDKEGMPVQTKMVEKNDDATTVRLMNIEKNQSIPMDQFKLNLDSNVKRVKG